MISFEDYPHVQDGYDYCVDVLTGVEVSCATVYNACRRQLDDLNREKFEYEFDPEKANRVVNFIELLPHTRGKWAGKKELLKLERWQKFLVTSIFGWVTKPGPPDDEYPDGRQGGFRRFRKVYFSVARKNGKSVLAAAIGLYLFCESGDDFAPEIFSGATNEKQAMEVFKPARMMCLKTPELVEHYDIDVNAKNLAQPGSGGKFEPVIGNPGDGSSPSCWIVDEYHEHASSDQVDTALSGMGSREEPLLLVTTTAGFDTSSPCYSMYQECKKMLDGSIAIDDQVFALIYELDDDDDYDNPKVWKKANPNYGVSVLTEYIKSNVASAQRNASDENRVRIKNFNNWVNAKAAWLNSQQWKACGDDDLYEGDFATDECIGAIDLSSKLDFTVFARIYLRIIDGERHYYVFVDHFLPRETVESRTNDSYLKWWKDGDVMIAGEHEIDYQHIAEHIEEYATLCNLREVTYDTWKCSQLAQQLEKKNLLMVEYRQQVKEMTQAMKEMEGAIASGRFHHNNCPVLNWEASNVTNKIDNKGNYYPTKENNSNKIDGIVAVIMGIGRAMYDLDNDENVYDKRGVREL